MVMPRCRRAARRRAPGLPPGRRSGRAPPGAGVAASAAGVTPPGGALDLLPGATAETLKAAETATHEVDGMLVNVAVGYGGRRELADAVRSLIADGLLPTQDRYNRSAPREP